VAVRKFDLCPEIKSKRPDPFDFSTLDAKNLMDGDEFDAFVASRSVQQSVS